MTPTRAAMDIDVAAWRSAIANDALANYHAEMGKAILREGNLPAAIEHFRRSLSHVPGDRATQVRLVAVLRRDGQDAPAQQIHAAAMAADPLYEPRGHCLIGLEAMREERWQAAEQALADAEHRTPGLAETAFCRRLLAVALGQGKGADAPPPPIAGIALDIAWRLVEEALSISNSAFAESRFAAMTEAARLALALDSDCARAQAQLGRGLTRLGRQGEAVAAFERAVAAEGEHADLLCAFAECLMCVPTGLERAGVLFERANALAPDNPLVHAGLINYLHKRGRFAEAVRLDRDMLEKNSGDPVVRARLAVSLLAGGQAAQAAAEFRRCLGNTPRPGLRTHLGLALLADGDTAAAAAVMEEALKQQPGDPWISSCLGLVRQAAGALDQALSLQRQASQADGSAWVQASLGLALAATGDQEGARAAWRLAAEREPWNLFYCFSLLPTFQPDLRQGYEAIGFTAASPFWPRD